jgi:hypothetical protein
MFSAIAFTTGIQFNFKLHDEISRYKSGPIPGKHIFFFRMFFLFLPVAIFSPHQHPHIS